jgi:hypothetical protein
MNWRLPSIALAAALLAATGVGVAAANAPRAVGIAASVLNRVTIARGPSAQMRAAVPRQPVALADRVETGQRSQLQILLLDRSSFTVGANARLTIDRFVYDPASGRSVSASVAKGAFRFMSGRPNRGGNSTIASPAASIGIRGTIVDGVVGADAIAVAGGERGAGPTQNADPQSATLVILRGPGTATRGNAIPGAITVTAGGKTVALDRPMLAVFIPREGAQPVGPFVMSLPGLTRVQGLIFPSLAQWRAATRPAGTGTYVAPQPRGSRRDERGYYDDTQGVHGHDHGDRGSWGTGYGPSAPMPIGSPPRPTGERQERTPGPTGGSRSEPVTEQQTPVAAPTATTEPAPVAPAALPAAQAETTSAGPATRAPPPPEAKTAPDTTAAPQRRTSSTYGGKQ